MKHILAGRPSLTAPPPVSLSSRRLAILISCAGYWFVVGIVGVIYLRYLGGETVRGDDSAMALFMLIAQQFDPLMPLLAGAVIGTRFFTYRWLRLDALERGESPPIWQLLHDAVFMPRYRYVRGRLSKVLKESLVHFAVTGVYLVSGWTGAFVAASVLLG